MISRETFIELGKGDIEWGDDEEPEQATAIPEDTGSQQLAILADHYLATEAAIAETEETLKRLNDRFRKIREDFIPEKMQELGIKKYVLTDGSTIAYAPFYAGKVLNEAGYDWLESNGYADAVKQKLELEVSRVDRATLDAIKDYIASDHSLANLSAKEKQSVHHMTLGSVIKSLTKQGRELPQNLIETFIGNRATIKRGTSND